MKFDFTIDKHLSEPGVNVNEYIRAQCIELGKQVNTRKIVYMDTKFWLILRDVSLGRIENEIAKKLYETVIKSVESQLCIYPISEDIFLEVIKQEDPATLDETVRLIDLLSLGVSQINFEEKLTLEFKYFLNCTRGKDRARSRTLFDQI